MATIWLVYEGDYEQRGVSTAFTSKEAAVATYGEDADVEEIELFDQPLPAWVYWGYFAEVYPDGSIVSGTKKYDATGPQTMEPVDDHLNRRDEPWDGHTQGHCGEHIAIFGTDRAKVRAAYKAAMVKALARCDGVCHGRFSTHEAPVDGITIYASGFWGETRVAVRSRH